MISLGALLKFIVRYAIVNLVNSWEYFVTNNHNTCLYVQYILMVLCFSHYNFFHWYTVSSFKIYRLSRLYVCEHSFNLSPVVGFHLKASVKRRSRLIQFSAAHQSFHQKAPSRLLQVSNQHAVVNQSWWPFKLIINFSIRIYIAKKKFKWLYIVYNTMNSRDVCENNISLFI